MRLAPHSWQAPSRLVGTPKGKPPFLRAQQWQGQNSAIPSFAHLAIWAKPSEAASPMIGAIFVVSVEKSRETSIFEPRLDPPKNETWVAPLIYPQNETWVAPLEYFGANVRLALVL